MNLENELRAVLSQEAEMTNATRPDIEGLLSGGQVRRRRRNVAWIGGIAAAIVFVGGGVVALTQIDGGDDGDSKTAAGPTETSGTGFRIGPAVPGRGRRSTAGAWHVPDDGGPPTATEANSKPT